MLLDEIKNIKSEKRDLRNFGLSVGGVLLIIGALLLWKQRPAYTYFVGIGGALFVLGFVFPRLLIPLQKVWMAFAVVMGWFMTRVILSILFYFIVTPISFLAKLFGSKLLELNIDSKQESYWNYLDSEPKDPRSYEKQF